MHVCKECSNSDIHSEIDLLMCVCMYVRMYVHVEIDLLMCVYMCVRMYVHVEIDLLMCVYMCAYVCACRN
jgi:hypothetical protein